MMLGAEGKGLKKSCYPESCCILMQPWQRQLLTFDITVVIANSAVCRQPNVNARYREELQ